MTGPVRVVALEGVDTNTCCGTHVPTTAHLQAVKLLRTERAKGNSKVAPCPALRPSARDPAPARQPVVSAFCALSAWASPPGLTGSFSPLSCPRRASAALAGFLRRGRARHEPTGRLRRARAGAPACREIVWCFQLPSHVSKKKKSSSAPRPTTASLPRNGTSIGVSFRIPCAQALTGKLSAGPAEILARVDDLSAKHKVTAPLAGRRISFDCSDIGIRRHGKFSRVRLASCPDLP